MLGEACTDVFGGRRWRAREGSRRRLGSRRRAFSSSSILVLVREESAFFFVCRCSPAREGPPTRVGLKKYFWRNVHPEKYFLGACRQTLSPPPQRIHECRRIRANSKVDRDSVFFSAGVRRAHDKQTLPSSAHCDLSTPPTALTTLHARHLTNALPTSGAQHQHHLTGVGACASVEENRRKAVQEEEGEADQRCSPLDGDVERGRPDVVLPQRHDRRERRAEQCRRPRVASLHAADRNAAA